MHRCYESAVSTWLIQQLRHVISIIDYPAPKEGTSANHRSCHTASYLSLNYLVQLGDIIRIRWDEDGLHLRVQEVKTGQVNDKIDELILTRKGILYRQLTYIGWNGGLAPKDGISALCVDGCLFLVRERRRV